MSSRIASINKTEEDERFQASPATCPIAKSIGKIPVNARVVQVEQKANGNLVLPTNGYTATSVRQGPAPAPDPNAPVPINRVVPVDAKPIGSEEEGAKDSRATYLPMMTDKMRHELYSRFPAEINEKSLREFEESMQVGIDSGNSDTKGGEFPAATLALARKYRRALERGMYICLKISDQVDDDSPFKISANATATEIMRERAEQGMRQTGQFFEYCTTNPDRATPWAHLAPNPRNPSAVTDWLQAFMRWTAVYMQDRNNQV